MQEFGAWRFAVTCPELDEDTPAWSLYLDASTLLRSGGSCQTEFKGAPSPRAGVSAKGPSVLGIPFKADKAIQNLTQVAGELP